MMGGAQFVAANPQPPHNEREAIAMLAGYVIGLIVVGCFWLHGRRRGQW